MSSITATSSHIINSHSESLNHLHNNSHIHGNQYNNSDLQSNINSSQALDSEVASINAGHDAATFGHSGELAASHNIQDKTFQENSQDNNKKGRRWEYMWVTQHHSVKDCPSHWTHPLNLLLKYAESPEAQNKSEAVEAESNHTSQSETTLHADSAAADTPVVDDNSSVISFITGQSA